MQNHNLQTYLNIEHLALSLDEASSAQSRYEALKSLVPDSANACRGFQGGVIRSRAPLEGEGLWYFETLASQDILKNPCVNCKLNI